MKKHWLIYAFATVVLALMCGTAIARDRSEQKQQKAQNRGQMKKQYRQFQENQRQYAHTYYGQNQNHAMFKPDNRWNNDYDMRIQPGYVLDGEMRRMIHPAPNAMMRGLGRAPRGYRYVVIGGHLVLIDNRYRVHDSIRFELHFGR
jgi:hypothetical protein